MSAKHTPGPWHVRTLDESIGGVDDSNDIPVANAQQVAHKDLVTANEIRKANAHLIAAAPELLAAAELVLAWYEAESDHAKDPDFYKRIEMCCQSEDAIRAAIAKAKGEL